MSENVKPQYMSFMYDSINEAYQGACEKIDKINELPIEVGLKVLSTIVSYACRPQNTAIIVLAREEMKKIPLEWLVQQLPKVVQTSINLEDEWEYRRLLELLVEAAPQIIEDYIKYGLTSNNEEVREAAEDIIDMISGESSCKNP